MPVSSSWARITPSNRPTVGKFWMPEKPSSPRVFKNGSTSRNGSVPLTPASTGVCCHHGQHLARHLEHDLVGVAVGQQAGERAAPGHAIAARVVDHDEVDAAGLLALGGQAGAGAAADDRLAAAHHAAQPSSGCPGAQFGPWGPDLVEVGDQRVGERRVVDVVRELQQLPVRRRRGSSTRWRRTAPCRPPGPRTGRRAGRDPRGRPRGSGSAPGPPCG